MVVHLIYAKLLKMSLQTLRAQFRL